MLVRYILHTKRSLGLNYGSRELIKASEIYFPGLGYLRKYQVMVTRIFVQCNKGISENLGCYASNGNGCELHGVTFARVILLHESNFN